MKKIIVILFLFLSLNVAYASEYIEPDDSFSMNFWVDFEDVNSYINWQPLLIMDDLANVIGSVVLERGSVTGGVGTWGLGMRFDSGGYVSWSGNLTPGLHLLSLNYGSGVNAGDPYMSSAYVALYVDGVRKNYSLGGGPGVMTLTPIGGYVSFDNGVIPGSFTYSPNVLTSEQIQSLLNFGEPGTIKYQINLLFWEVIKHFRSFF